MTFDKKDLKFQYIGPTEDVRFYGYMDSKELFNAIKNSQIKFSDAVNKQNEFLNKLNNTKIGKKTTKQKGVINNITRLTFLEKKLLIFSETMLKCYLMQITMLHKIKLKEKGLKY